MPVQTQSAYRQSSDILGYVWRPARLRRGQQSRGQGMLDPALDMQRQDLACRAGVAAQRGIPHLAVLGRGDVSPEAQRDHLVPEVLVEDIGVRLHQEAGAAGR